MKSLTLKPLAVTFFVSGVWDTIAGVLYFFIIGTGRKISEPPIDPFFSIFMGSFFLCFAYIQFLSAFNIRRYSFNVGCLIIGRTFYITQLFLFMGLVKEFPSTFWFTGIIDCLITVLYFIFAMKGGLRLNELFLPSKE